MTYPIVSGAIAVATKKKLENTISYWKVFETTLQANINEDDWLWAAYYKVNYNKNGILDISLTQEGSAAYPSTDTRDLVIDLKTGEQVKFADAFNSDSLAEFAKLVDIKLKAEVVGINKRIDKGEFGEDGKYLKEELSGLEITAESFNEYRVTDKGVTILYDAGFPHAIAAVQPDGLYFFSWAELKPFVKSDGLLGKFLK